MGGFYHPERSGASLARAETSKGPPSASPSISTLERVTLFAELLDLPFDGGAVLLERRQQLLRGLGIDRASRRDVDLRGQERRLGELGEIAGLGRLILANRGIADLECRHTEHELRRRRRRDAVGRRENRHCMLEVLTLRRIRGTRVLIRLVAEHEQELRDRRLVLPCRHGLFERAYRAVWLVQIDLRLRDAEIAMLRLWIELHRRLRRRERLRELPGEAQRLRIERP